MIKKYFVLVCLSLFIKDTMSHTLLEEVTTRRKDAQQQVEVGAIYSHYRNPKLQYKVIDIGIQEATEKACVIYKALYADEVVWVRDLDVWLEPVEHEGKKVPRFQKVK